MGFRILIIDDEELIRDGLAIMAKRLGLFDDEGIRTASDGYEALNIYRDFKPHIIITDIKMPEMDGLEFIKLIRDAGDERVKIAILSGYGEFAYVRSALKFGVMEYLLKPVNRDELSGLVHKLIEQIQNEKIEEDNNQINLIQAREAESIKKDKEFISVISGKLSYNEIIEKMARLNLSFLSEGFQIFAIEMENAENRDLNLIQQFTEDFSIRKAVNEFIAAKKYDAHLFFDLFNRLIGIIRIDVQSCDTGEINRELFQGISSLIGNTFKMTVTVAVSGIHAGMTYIPAAYRQTEEALRHNNASGGIIYYEYIQNKKIESLAINRAVEYIISNYNKNITLKEVADYLLLNECYFSTLFKKITGRNFIDYLTEYRVEKAGEMLINTEMRVYEIAEKVGYFSEKHFYKVFKKITGMSPNKYKAIELSNIKK